MIYEFDKRAIAVQGIGYGPRHMAVHGFVPRKRSEDAYDWWAGRSWAGSKKRQRRDEEELLLVVNILGL